MAEKRLRLAEERLAEIEVIANGSNIGALERLRHRYEFQMNRTENLANKLNSTELDSWITEHTGRHIEVLTELRGRLPVQAHKGIDRALEVSTKYFGVHMSRMAVRIQQIKGEGVNTTQLRMKLEILRNRTMGKVMEFKKGLENGPPLGYDIDIEIPDVPNFSMRKGNETIPQFSGNMWNETVPRIPDNKGNKTQRGPP
jgi:hypothetical protein